MATTGTGSKAGSLQQGLVAETIAQHGNVLALVGAMRGADDRDALVEVLQKLETFLREHFRAEEAPDGLYETLSAQAPQF